MILSKKLLQTVYDATSLRYHRNIIQKTKEEHTI